MEKINVTVRINTDKVSFLDQLAKNDDRDRSYLINEAIEGYLQLRRWQLEEIQKAIREADAGEFATEKETQKAFGELLR